MPPRWKQVHKTPLHFDSVEEALGPTRQAAFRSLARREYGANELLERLCLKGFPRQAVEFVIKQLQEKDLQSDERFVEVFVRSRKSRGQGPVRIRADLQQLSISEALITHYLDAENEWGALAKQVRDKRFGVLTKISREEKARQQRFLYYRGFSMEQINVAFEQTEQ